MTRSLYVLPLALLLTAGYPPLTLADDATNECRKMAAEEEVAPEDMEDYIAECLAVVQSETPEDAAAAVENLQALDQKQPPAPAPAPTKAPKP